MASWSVAFSEQRVVMIIHSLYFQSTRSWVCNYQNENIFHTSDFFMITSPCFFLLISSCKFRLTIHLFIVTFYSIRLIIQSFLYQLFFKRMDSDYMWHWQLNLLSTVTYNYCPFFKTWILLQRISFFLCLKTVTVWIFPDCLVLNLTCYAYLIPKITFL